MTTTQEKLNNEAFEGEVFEVDTPDDAMEYVAFNRMLSKVKLAIHELMSFDEEAKKEMLYALDNLVDIYQESCANSRD